VPLINALKSKTAVLMWGWSKLAACCALYRCESRSQTYRVSM